MRRIAALLLALSAASPTLAQNPGTIGPPPVRQSIDGNGVDVLRGKFLTALTDITIGPAAEGLSFRRFAYDGLWSNDEIATLDKSGNTVIVTLEGSSDSFTQNGATYTPTEGNGASLEDIGGAFRYTSRDGTVAIFTSTAGGLLSFYKANLGRISTITWPNGLRQAFAYTEEEYCGPGYEGGSCPVPIRIAARLQSVTNTRGYQLSFAYAYNGGDLTIANYRSWAAIVSVTASNNAAPAQNWPVATYQNVTDGMIVTDALNRATRYLKNPATGEIRIKRAGATADTTVVGYGANGVSSVLRDGVSYSYAYADSGTTRTTTVTDPLGGVRTYVGDTGTFLLASFRDELNRTTSYVHDAQGRIKEVISPEGNRTLLSYDARGNVTERRIVSKTPGTPPDIVTSASFPAACANPRTCNKPEATTDARGHVTNYAYDGTHGGVTSVTAPAPVANGTRPQTRIGYDSFQAYYRQSAGGSPVASGLPIVLPVSVAACRTNASCTGGADEVKTVIGYGPQAAGTGNNLLPVSTASGAGDGSLTATALFVHDAIGNQTHVDGPLLNVDDTTRIFYNANREVIGVIGPDPDGAGPLKPLKHRARRNTYNSDGQITLAEAGTTEGQSNADWAAFAPLQQVASEYDANARKRVDVLQAGATSYQLTQYSYDDLGRPKCTAVRLNRPKWGTLPPTACDAQDVSDFGPDRISRIDYTAASEVWKRVVGLDTGNAQDVATEATLTYTGNGKVASLTDGNGNQTLYDYDGHDRPLKTTYPNPLTSDFEQVLSYDPNGNATRVRLRDASEIGFSYDNLDRRVTTDFSNGADQSFGYDLFGRLTGANDAFGHAVGIGYDALGRVVTETGVYGGTKTSQYDLAGRRTRLSWAGGFDVDYDHLITGEVTHVREEGATSGIGVLGTYAYDDLGRRTSLTRGNGTTTSYTHDPASRLTGLVHDVANAARDLTLGMTFNPAMQIATRTASNDAYAWGQHFNRDVTETIDGLNRLTSQSPGAALSYDGRGNVISIGSTAYSYDQRNLPVTIPGGGLLHSDPLGRLDYVGPNAVNPSETLFDYDGDRLIAEATFAEGYTKRYVHGPGTDEVLTEYSGTGLATRTWLHQDERGSTIARSDESGTVTSVLSYDEYGTPASTNIGRFQYTGQAWMPELGLHYYKARMYNPRIGRFMQTDPIGTAGGINLYAYVRGDPINLVDPSGLYGDDITVRANVCPPGYYGQWPHCIAEPRDLGLELDLQALLEASRDLTRGIGRSSEGGAGPQRANTCAANRARHQAALEKELQRYSDAGFRVTRNVSFRDPQQGGLRVVADAAIGFWGPVGAPGLTPPAHILIDVKTGGGGFTSNQGAIYPKIGTNYTLVPVGLRAFQAGYIPGLAVNVAQVAFEAPRYDANGNRCE